MINTNNLTNHLIYMSYLNCRIGLLCLRIYTNKFWTLLIIFRKKKENIYLTFFVIYYNCYICWLNNQTLNCLICKCRGFQSFLWYVYTIIKIGLDRPFNNKTISLKRHLNYCYFLKIIFWILFCCGFPSYQFKLWKKHFLTFRKSWMDICSRCIQQIFVQEMRQNGRRGLMF